MIRHSTLPKLAECLCYESKPGEAGPAAQRGTMLDGRFREALATGTLKDDDLSPDDSKALKWALQQVKDIAKGKPILSKEEDLKVKTPGMEHIGTEDVRIPDLQISCDLKTGSIRSYKEQQAAYAWGNMESHFCEEWACYLIFCDQREITELHFTLEQAKEIVKGILDAHEDPFKEPTPCQYCSWCAKKDTCKAIVEPTKEAQSIMESGQNLEALRQEIANDPVRLGRFLQLNRIFESELVKPLKDAAKEQVESGTLIPGWKLSVSNGTEFVDAVTIVSAAVRGKFSLNDLVDALGGTMKADTFRELCEKYRIPVQEEQIQKKESVTRLIEDKPKKTKSK